MGKIVKTGITDEEKELFQNHICYEIWMLNCTYNILNNGISIMGDSERQKAIENALIESFCIHARNIIELLTNNKQCAIDTTKVTTGYQINRKFLEGYRRMINNQISHIGKERTANDLKKINPEDRNKIYDEINKKFRNFKDTLAPEYKSLLP